MNHSNKVEAHWINRKRKNLQHSGSFTKLPITEHNADVPGDHLTHGKRNIWYNERVAREVDFEEKKKQEENDQMAA